MKYRYYYQTRQNENREGIITAKDRNDAYSQLKKLGIKPFKVVGRDPLRWKPWATAAFLALIALILAALLVQNAALPQELPRAQLYGDPAIIQQLSADGWRKSFSVGDAWFARHAIPATLCDCRENTPSDLSLSTKPLPLRKSDPPELIKMKQMINGMKRELTDYLSGGGTAQDYKLLCDERMEIERGKLAIYKKELENLSKSAPSNLESLWEAKNDELRDMGLPTIILPTPD